MNLLIIFDPLLIFGTLLAMAWLVLAVVGIFRRSSRQKSSGSEE